MSSYYQKHIFVCTNQKDPGKACCANQGGKPFFSYLKDQLKSLGLFGPDKMRVSQSGCLGRCALGPCIVVYPEAVWYRYETQDDIDEIIQQHLLHEKVVPRLMIKDE